MNLLEQANTLAQSGDSANAIALYDQYLQLDPNNAAAWNNRGNALDDLKQRGDAIASFDKALALAPNYPLALCNKGVALEALHQHAQALACFDACLAEHPMFAMAHNNRGNALRALGRLEEAVISFQQAYAIDPHFHNARWNESLCRLLMGDYDLGWQQFESRWQAPGPIGQLLETPRSTWLGKEPIAGKRIILWPEGGDGDVFQFVRFAKLVQQMGASVVMAVRTGSFRLFQHNFPHLELLPMVEHAPVPASNFQSSLMSLPLACGVNSLFKIPANTPYLAAPPPLQALWHGRLQSMTSSKPSRRIGLCWAGNGITDVDSDRSLALSQFEPLSKLAHTPKVQWISLQKGVAALDLSGFPLLDFSDSLHDWADTAALIANLDLVISCDTGVAHLAAAMGKPTWILSRKNGCWRWLNNRSDSPWYPSVRLFRQTTFGDWGTVMEEVAMALRTQFNES